MKDLKLNTVCEDARCPNIGECWHHGTATFMILGDVCTRACAYCAVAHGRPNELDMAEPARVAEAVARMGLQYAVITSVDRDDLADGGAFIFAETIRLTRERVRPAASRCSFRISRAWRRRCGPFSTPAPTCSTTTRKRCRGSTGWRAPAADTRARWNCSIAHAATSRQSPPRPASWWALARRSTRSSPYSTICGSVGVSILTIGQYLRPTPQHARMTRYYHPDEFAELKAIALGKGFVHVESGPLVRSSYHAHEQADAFAAAIEIDEPACQLSPFRAKAAKHTTTVMRLFRPQSVDSSFSRKIDLDTGLTRCKIVMTLPEARLPSISATESLILDLLESRERFGLEMVDSLRRATEARLHLRDPRPHGDQRVRGVAPGRAPPCRHRAASPALSSDRVRPEGSGRLSPASRGARPQSRRRPRVT